MITIHLRQAALLPADPSQDQSENQNQDRTQIENQDGAQIENQDGTQIENQIERVTSSASAEVPMRAEASPREATMRTIALVLYLSYTSEPSIQLKYQNRFQVLDTAKSPAFMAVALLICYLPLIGE